MLTAMTELEVYYMDNLRNLYVIDSCQTSLMQA